MAAGEQLFARHGIHRVRLREIYALAGQRNSSALHYYFGSRDGLVEAILTHHQQLIDLDLETSLDLLEAGGTQITTRRVLDIVVPPFVAKLDSPSGRNFLRIVPQVSERLSSNLRAGYARPATNQSRRLLRLLSSLLPDMSEPLRIERMIAYVLLLTGTLAERAQHIESGRQPLIDNQAFANHLVGILDAMLMA